MSFQECLRECVSFDPLDDDWKVIYTSKRKKDGALRKKGAYKVSVRWYKGRWQADAVRLRSRKRDAIPASG